METLSIVLAYVGIPLVGAWVYCGLSKTSYVKGSRQRWVRATIEKTVSIPVLIWYALWTSVALTPVGFGIRAILTLMAAWVVWRSLNDDEDSWWKGKGKKIKNWITSSLTVHQSVTNN